MAKLVVIIGFLIAFAAGLTVGVATRTVGLGSLSSMRSSPTTRPSGGRGRFLIDALNLTPPQSEQLSKIWSARPGPHDFEQRRSEIRRERDEAILALVPQSQRLEYDQVQQTYRRKMESIGQELHASFDNKVQQTRAILTPEQRAKYEEILRQHQSDHGPRGRGGPHQGESRRSSDQATSRPTPASGSEATQPQ